MLSVVRFVVRFLASSWLGLGGLSVVFVINVARGMSWSLSPLVENTRDNLIFIKGLLEKGRCN